MARIHFVVIDDEYFVVPTENLHAIELILLDAVRAGGSFVSFGTAGHAVEVLVTPCTRVRLEHARVDEDASDDLRGIGGVGRPGVDWDWWPESA